jgi:hypothetical protein
MVPADGRRPPAFIGQELARKEKALGPGKKIENQS